MSFLASPAAAESQLGEPVRVARWPGYFALACALAAGILLLDPGHGVVLPLIGYLLGAVITPVFAIVHRVSFEDRRKSPWFVSSPAQNRVVAIALTLGVLTGLANAWALATELAKR